MVWRISGARMPFSMAGWAQANIRARRRSGMSSGALAAASISSAMSCRCSSPVRRVYAAAQRVGLTAAGHGEQPGVGIVGHAGLGPQPQRGREGLGQRILGARDVAGAGGEEGDEAAVAVARDVLGGAARLVGRQGLLARRGDRPDFDRAVLGAGAAPGPGDGLIEIGGLDEEVAGELLLGVGIGAVEDGGLATGDADVVAAELGSSRSPLEAPALASASLKAP